MKKIAIIFIAFFVIDIVVFWNLWGTYFQQDEWFLFGRAINQTQELPFSIFNFASKHFWPLGNLFWLLLYKVFNFNAFYYSLVALLLQATVTTILFFFFKIFTKNVLVSLIMAGVFTLSFPSMQPVVWFVIPPFLITSIIFILLFFIILEKTKERLNSKDVFILCVTYIISFLFREEAVVLIALFPLYIIFFSKQLKRRILKPTIVILAVMIVMVALRFGLEPFLGDDVQFEKDSPKVTTLYNLVTIPPKMIIQNFIELEHLWDLSRTYTRLAFPRFLTDGWAIENVIFEHVILALFIPFALILGYIFAKMEKSKQKILIFSFAWILIYSLILSPQTRRVIFLESRYLYFGNIGVLLMLYVIFSHLYVHYNKHRKIILGIAGCTVIVFAVYSYLNIQRYINDVYIPRSKERVEIIKQINKIKPNIPKKTVFYIKCLEENDCIPNGLVLPFQSGVGQMLLVLYGSKNEEAYSPFFKEFYLWDWEAEDYREINGYGFGYFRNFKKIEDLVRDGKIFPDEVLAFSYDRSENKIYDVTEKTRYNLSKVLELAP